MPTSDTTDGFFDDKPSGCPCALPHPHAHPHAQKPPYHNNPAVNGCIIYFEIREINITHKKCSI